MIILSECEHMSSLILLFFQLQPGNIISAFANEASNAVTGLAKVWFGPFRCYLAVLSPETIKTILGTAGMFRTLFKVRDK